MKVKSNKIVVGNPERSRLNTLLSSIGAIVWLILILFVFFGD